MNKTSDYIEFDKVLNKGQTLLNDKRKCRVGFYIILSLNTGLRVGDVLNIRHRDLYEDKLVIAEQKTKKKREITINPIVRKSYNKLAARLNEQGIKFKPDDYIFLSQKGSRFRTQSINYMLKSIFQDKRIQVSSHTLRKSFARRVYENMNESEDALVLLSEIFSHSSVSITRRYLGIRRETIANVYLTLV